VQMSEASLRQCSFLCTASTEWSVLASNFCLTIPLSDNKKNRPVENPLGRLGANEQNYR
jgi:hypothetical protein